MDGLTLWLSRILGSGALAGHLLESATNLVGNESSGSIASSSGCISPDVTLDRLKVLSSPHIEKGKFFCKFIIYEQE